MAVNQIMFREICAAGRGVYTSGAVITPGCLIELDTDGKVVPNYKSGMSAQKMVALEKPNSKNVDDNYKVGVDVYYKLCRAGDQLNAFLANGESVVISDLLCSSGNGVFKKVSTTQEVAIAISLEAITAVGDTRILIEVL